MRAIDMDLANTRTMTNLGSGVIQSKPRKRPVLTQGQTLAGRYEIQHLIGEGGMGKVYSATHTQLGREVVVKILDQDIETDDVAAVRFEREARGLSQLDHANIVTLYDFGHQDGVTYIVMERVQGQTLEEFLESSGPLSADEFTTIAAQILDALGEVHTHNLIHRDIKPSNVMLCRRGDQELFVKLIDFGLTRLLGTSEDITKQNLLGSVYFLSPEQIKGNPIDQRTDIYSIGVLFYYMLTGEFPHTGADDFSILSSHLYEAPQPLSVALPFDTSVSRGLQQLVHACLAKSPDDRPRDANAVLRLLNRQINTVEKPTPTREMPPPPPPPSGPTVMQSPMPFAPRGQPLQRPHAMQRLPQPQLPAIPPMQLAQSATARMHAPIGPSTERVPVRRESRTEVWAAFQVVLLVLVLSVLGVMFLGGSSRSDQGAAPAHLSSVIGQAEQLAASEKFGEAQFLLDSIQAQVGTDPTFLVRVARVRETITGGSLAAKAAQREAEGDVAGAMALYRRVLVRNPDHPASLAAVARIKLETDARPNTRPAPLTVDPRAASRAPAAEPNEQDLAHAWKKVNRRRWRR
jgi:eukaryotic-like serine/threonine-protein kinase